MTLTPTEQEELRIAIAEEMGWTKCRLAIKGAGGGTRRPTPHGIPPGRNYECSPPPYTTSIDAIQAASLERFKTELDIYKFKNRLDEIVQDKCDAGAFVRYWQLTALDWCFAFARTSKIWRYKV